MADTLRHSISRSVATITVTASVSIALLTGGSLLSFHYRNRTLAAEAAATRAVTQINATATAFAAISEVAASGGGTAQEIQHRLTSMLTAAGIRATNVSVAAGKSDAIAQPHGGALLLQQRATGHMLTAQLSLNDFGPGITISPLQAMTEQELSPFPTLAPLSVTKLAGGPATGGVVTVTTSKAIGSDLGFIAALSVAWALCLATAVALLRRSVSRSLDAPLNTLKAAAQTVEGLLVRKPAQQRDAQCQPATTGSQVVDALIGHIHELQRQLAGSAEAIADWAAKSQVDSLTQLANRFRLEGAYREVSDGSDHGYLVYCDVGGIALLNQTEGFAAGDAALVMAAAAIQSAAAASGGLPARISGDRFAILMPGASADIAIKVAESLSDSHNTEPSPRVRINAVAVAFTSTQDDVSSLLSRAEIVAAHAKSTGGRSNGLWEGLDVESAAAIERALQSEDGDDVRGQVLQLGLQPIVELRARRIAHYECLLRVRHPLSGAISSGYPLIVTAERHGTIHIIDKWVLRSAFDLLQAHEGLRLAVNVSAITASHSDHSMSIVNCIRDSGLGPRLMIELTETAQIGTGVIARRFVADLRALGVDIALDDFGAGYSTLHALLEYQVTHVKIDGYLTRRARFDSAAAQAVESVMQIASKRGMKVIAEFVEDEVSAAWLTRIGIDYGQGELFGMASPVTINGELPTVIEPPVSELELPPTSSSIVRAAR